MEQNQQFVARAIYHHRSNELRHVTVLVFRNLRTGGHELLLSDCCFEQPICWEGPREEVLEQWRHLNRSLQNEWFLHDRLACRDPDFEELLQLWNPARAALKSTR